MSSAEASHKVRTLTPKGDEIWLPAGATAIDFAYAVHLELGHECTGALVNGRAAPLAQPLQDGDIVKILTSQAGVGPALDWLEVVQTRRARSAIRHWLKEQGTEAALAVPPYHSFELTAVSRPDLIADVTGLIARSGLNLSRFRAEQLADGTTQMQIGLEQVTAEVLGQLQRLDGVQRVTARVETRPSPLPTTTNPHTLRPVSGEGFFGRRAELRELVNNLRGMRPGEAVLLWGARRVGKTSLLMQFQQNVLGQGDYLPLFIDMQRLSGRSTSRFLHDIYKSIAEALDGEQAKAPTVTRMRRDPLGFFRSFLENEPRLANRHLVLILDEFQLLAELEEDAVTVADINRYFRSLIQHGRGLTVIFSGGGVLDVLLQQPAAAFLLEVARYQQIGCLDEAGARQLIVESVSHVHYEEAVVASLLSLTAGHPYYLQWVCGELVARAERDGRSHINSHDLTTLLTEWLPGQGEQFFSHLWGSSVGLGREKQQRYKVVVTAVAQANKSWQPFNKIARTLSPYLAESEVWRLAQDLVKMDTLLVMGKRYALKVPLFARWLRANLTVEGVVREE